MSGDRPRRGRVWTRNWRTAALRPRRRRFRRRRLRPGGDRRPGSHACRALPVRIVGRCDAAVYRELGEVVQRINLCAQPRSGADLAWAPPQGV